MAWNNGHNLTKETVDKIKALRQEGLSQREVSRRVGCSRTTVQKYTDGGCEWTPVAEIKEQATREVEERTIEEHTREERALSTARYSKKQLRDAVRRIAELEDRLRDMQWAAEANAQPAEWTYRPRNIAKKSEHMPYLLTSDHQIGEVVKASQTDHGYGYDIATYRSRYRSLIETTLYLSDKHVGDNWIFPGIIYARGGDTVNGALRMESVEVDEITPIEACEVAFEEESAGITKLADYFGKVEVKDVMGGNHDRDVLKPQSANRTEHSYDRLVSYMLRIHFRADKRVTFQTTESTDVFFPIYDKNILLTHGDNIGSRGGTGYAGPILNIVKGAQKVAMEQAAIGRIIHRMDVGHFHTFAFLSWLLANGSMPGYNTFAKSHRMRPEEPEQTLLFHHPKRGVVDVKPIWLR